MALVVERSLKSTSMSVEATNGAARDNRRASRRNAEDSGEGGHLREIELKRSRGEISCAECRRLKIKCDKKLPCSSCLRRGCAALCPNGSLATGQGTRFVMAATDHLHRRVTKMSERIRQLEDALAILQSGTSSDPHPLLRDELLSLKIHKADEPVGDGDHPAETPDMIDAFGTLAISDRGTSRFFGAAGGTELLLNGDDRDSHYGSPSAASATTPESCGDSKASSLPPEMIRFSMAFPFTPMGPPHAVQEMVESHLPPWERAWSLCQTYLEQAAWLFHAISRQQILDEMLPIIYKRKAPLDASHEYAGPHDLAVLYMVFAVGALVDLTQEPYNAEAEHYYQLAKAAICLQSILEKPELVTIQALHLMSIYNAMSQNDGAGGNDTSMEMSWSLIRLCIQLSQIIGLHRDSARWGLNPRDVQRRRALFWDLFVAESWQSLSTGRPPSITVQYIDCQFPLDDEERLNDKGGAEPSFGSWGFRFACECVAEIVAKTFTAQVPSYSTILDLDRIVREFPIPEFPADLPLDPSKPSMIMTRYVLSHSREVMLLCIHRSFFAQAMIDDPVNPLRSQYATSFLAAYRSAAHILKSIKEQFDLLPELCSRFWSTWTFAFSSAVVFGTVVTRGPGSSMAQSSLVELDEACELFSKAALHSRRASKALSVLQKLQGKAHHAYSAYLASKSSPAPEDGSIRLREEQKEDELAIFGGLTRLVSPKRITPSPPSSHSVPPISRVSPPVNTPPPPPAHTPVREPRSSSIEFVPDVRVQDWSPIAHDIHRDYSPIYSNESFHHQYMQPHLQPIQHRQPHQEPPTSLEWAPPQILPEPPMLPREPMYHPPLPPMDFQALQSHYHAQSQSPPFPFYSSSGVADNSYAPPPRELAEMGLASQDSGLNQRWTSFMQESGVFYGNPM